MQGKNNNHHHLLPAQMGCERRGIKQHQFKRERERERELTLVLYTFASLTKYPTLAQGATKSEQLPLGALLLFNSTHTLAAAAQLPPPTSARSYGGKKNSRSSKKPSISLTRKWCRPPNRAHLSLTVLDSHSSPTTSVRACRFWCAATKKQRDNSRESRDFAVPTLLPFLLTSIKKEKPGVTTTFPQKPVSQKPTTQSSKQQQQPQHLSRQSRSPRKQQAHDRHRNNPNPR